MRGGSHWPRLEENKGLALLIIVCAREWTGTAGNVFAVLLKTKNKKRTHEAP